MVKSNWEELEIFLGGTFHQDINSPEEALEDYLKDLDKEMLKSLIKEIELFLNSNLSFKEKEVFIQNNAEIYFPAINSTPLDWLETVLIKMKEIL